MMGEPASPRLTRVSAPDRPLNKPQLPLRVLAEEISAAVHHAFGVHPHPPRPRRLLDFVGEGPERLAVRVERVAEIVRYRAPAEVDGALVDRKLLGRSAQV